MAFLGLADAIISISPQPWRPWPNEDRFDRGRFTPWDALASDRRIPFMSTYGKISRRTWLKGMAVFSAAGVPMILASTAAEAKASSRLLSGDSGCAVATQLDQCVAEDPKRTFSCL